MIKRIEPDVTKTQTKKVYLIYVNCFLNLDTIEWHLQSKFQNNKFVHSFFQTYYFTIYNIRYNFLYVFIEFENKIALKNAASFSFYDSRTQNTYTPQTVTSVTTNKLILINELLEYGRDSFVNSTFKASPELKIMIQSKVFTNFEILNQFLKKGFIQKISSLLEQNTYRNSSRLDNKTKTILLNFLKNHYKKS
jgi:hypothetical protein